MITSTIRKFATTMAVGAMAVVFGGCENAALVYAGKGGDKEWIDPQHPCLPLPIIQIPSLLCHAIARAPETCEAEFFPGCYMKKIAENAGITDPALLDANIQCAKMCCGCAPCAYAHLRNAVVDAMEMDQSHHTSCCGALPCCASTGDCGCGYLAAGNWAALIALNDTVNKSKGGAPTVMITDAMEMERNAESKDTSSRPALR